MSYPLPKPLLLFFIALLSSINLLAKEDSLLAVINGKYPEVEKMRAMAAHGFLYHMSIPDSTIYYAQLCIDYSKNFGESSERASCFNTLGLGYHRKGMYKLALSAFDEALRFYEQAKEFEQAARVYLNKSQVYSIQKDFFNAQKYAMKSLRFYEETKDSLRLAASYQTVAMICREIKDFNKAINYINRSADIFESLGLEDDWGNSIGIRGNIYRVQQRYEEAISDYNRSIAAYKKKNNLTGVAIAHENLGEAYMALNDYNKALEHYNIALEHFERLNNETEVAYETLKKASALKKLNRFDEALKALNVAKDYFERNDLFQYLVETYEQIYLTYKAIDRKAEALKFYEFFIQLRDSLSEAQNKEEIMRIQMAFEAEKQENEIALLQANQAKQSAELKLRSLVIYTLMALFIISLAFFIFWRRKLALQQELKKQTMLAQIASDLHDDVGASLSAIKMFGEIIYKKTSEKHPDIAPMAEKIAGNSEEMIHAMSDIVWAIKPGNNDGKALHDRLFQTAVDLCSSKGIKIKFADVSDALSARNLDVEFKKDIYLMTKEAINNAAKYAEASILEVDMQLTDEKLQISVKDNGKGFDKDWTHGNGITNMKTRCMKHQGEMQIITHKPGVEIRFSIPLRS